MEPGDDSQQDQRSELSFYSACELPTAHGEFQVRIYRDEKGQEHLLLKHGAPAEHDSPFVRIHSECFTGEVLGSLKCDCRDQLDNAMKKIAAEGCGAIVYLRQEGRGIGLGDKIRAYAEQERGADTIEANTRLGLPVDSRNFGIAADILRLNGIESVRLNTNNPQKIASLQRGGITITEVISSPASTNPHNAHYIHTKHEQLGHLGLKNSGLKNGTGN